MYRICVIDNSTLVNLTKLKHLKIFNHLRTLFKSIHVPAKIFQEYQMMLPYEPDRQWVIDQMQQPNYGFISYCTKYDSISHAILQTTTGIDAGEAEAAAQHKSLNSQYVLSDDQGFIKAIRLADKNTKILNTLHLIALLDFNQVIKKPSDFLKVLHKHSPFTESQLRKAYREIISNLGLYVSKKVIKEKTSFKIHGLA